MAIFAAINATYVTTIVSTDKSYIPAFCESINAAIFPTYNETILPTFFKSLYETFRSTNWTAKL